MSDPFPYHYETTGAGPPVMLLHGFTGSVETWAEHTPVFVAAGFRVITVDLPGHGRTDVPPDPARYRMEPVTADLATLGEKIAGEPVHLLGYSMGGRLALGCALRYPGQVRSLVLESASPGLATAAERTARRQRDEALAERLEREGVEAFVTFWEALPLWRSQERLPAEVRARLRAQRLRNRAQGLANSLRGMGTGVQPSFWNRLSELTMPTLLLVGAEDQKFRGLNARMAARIPQAERIVVPGAGHTVHLEQARRFQEHVLGFWKRVG